VRNFQPFLLGILSPFSTIHQFPAEELDPSLCPKRDFIRYFYPAIEDHPDIGNRLAQLVQDSNMKQHRLIHGDYNLKNVLVADGKYTIIDWTNGQLGDPRYDIAWSVLLVRIYVGERQASAYLRAFRSGNSYTAEEMDLFEAIACLR
jgi:aminoglycoside phosphotransferase (APT) family kinase protein